MNKKNLRIDKIINIIKENKNISVKEISSMVGVSEMTVRRDLKVLKAGNIIDHSYGRISYKCTSEDLGYEYELSAERFKQNAEKDRIGQFAASLIEPGDILIIDNGSTTDKLAKYIPSNLDITVLCYNLNVLERLYKKRGVSLILAGGYFHPKDQMFESVEGIEMIKRLRANKLFISASGIHETLGMTCANDYEVLTKRAILQSSLKKILLVDSTKFGKVITAYFAQLSEIDVVITDNGITHEWREHIQSLGIKLHIT